MSARLFTLGTQKLSRVRHAITSFYLSNPRLANACTGCLTFTMGDILAQKIQHRNKRGNSQVDYWRSAHVGMLGLVMNGVFLYHWYNVLDKVVGSSMTSKVGVAIKVAADQFIYAPFAIMTFFYFTSVRETSNVAMANQDFKNKVHDNFLTTFLADCTLWPLSNFVNFRYVNLAYRPSFTAVIQLLWQTYLSVTSHTKVLDANTTTKKVNSAPQDLSVPKLADNSF